MVRRRIFITAGTKIVRFGERFRLAEVLSLGMVLLVSILSYSMKGGRRDGLYRNGYSWQRKGTS